ncbi:MULTISPECIES: hypothetical protein [Vibrio]|uniref:hypothetical protein n=1 Tax=Vibrio TaxID=662 RepID=UPI0010BD260A|nr:hypothetical protein [Vibrio sp. F12]TKE74378.1 hypothetical protein FCV54_24515 [Vibrio sp. F12]
MGNEQTISEPLRASGEKGVHSKIDWINEAESKLVSALILREAAKEKLLELKQITSSRRASSQDVFNLLQPRESANKSSFLLLGYAIELLLKSGVVSLLIYAPKHLLERKVQNYSHNLLRISDDLHIKLNKAERGLLTKLSSFIVNETRYPVTVNSIQEYCEKTNKITAQLSSEKLFELGVGIYENIKSVIQDIDGTEQNPKLYNKVDIDSDGYVTFRVGGSLPPILIIKYSGNQVTFGKNNLSDLKLLIEHNYSNCIQSHLMLKSWDYADIYLVCEKKGLTKLSR